jgi:hypothetical protein
VTPVSRHVLDADTRFPKLRKSAIRVIRSLVAMSLQRHQEVHLIIAEGNHDEESSGWLSDLFFVHYEEEPRISVSDSVLPFYVFEWGSTMLGVHHGHKVKNESLPLLFAAQFSQEWGSTTRREIHCGHQTSSVMRKNTTGSPWCSIQLLLLGTLMQPVGDGLRIEQPGR